MIAPSPFAAHGGNRLLGGKKEAERVDAPGALEILRLDLLDIAPDARARVIDERVDVAEIGAHGGERRLDRGRLGDIAGVRLGEREFGGELGRKLRASRHQRHRIAVGGETPGERLAIARADADHRADRGLFVRHRSHPRKISKRRIIPRSKRKSG